MTLINALVVTTDFTMSLQSIDADAGDDLNTLVGGWFQTAPCTDPELTFWVNEEGKLHGMPLNDVATEMWLLTSPSMRGHDYLVGTVVITGGVGPEGETLTLPSNWATKFAESFDIEMPEGMTR